MKILTDVSGIKYKLIIVHEENYFSANLTDTLTARPKVILLVIFMNQGWHHLELLFSIVFLIYCNKCEEEYCI